MHDLHRKFMKRTEHAEVHDGCMACETSRKGRERSEDVKNMQWMLNEDLRDPVC